MHFLAKFGDIILRLHGRLTSTYSVTVMLLKYVPSFELNTGHISSLGFSKCRRILAVNSTAGEIGLWDTASGTRYNPVLSLGTCGTSSTLWIESSIFACGLS